VLRTDHLFREVLPGVCLIVCDLVTSNVRRPRPELLQHKTKYEPVLQRNIVTGPSDSNENLF
jgi:hypothetical protein